MFNVFWCTLYKDLTLAILEPNGYGYYITYQGYHIISISCSYVARQRRCSGPLGVMHFAPPLGSIPTITSSMATRALRGSTLYSLNARSWTYTRKIHTRAVYFRRLTSIKKAIRTRSHTSSRPHSRNNTLPTSRTYQFLPSPKLWFPGRLGLISRQSY